MPPQHARIQPCEPPCGPFPNQLAVGLHVRSNGRLVLSRAFRPEPCTRLALLSCAQIWPWLHTEQLRPRSEVSVRSLLGCRNRQSEPCSPSTRTETRGYGIAGLVSPPLELPCSGGHGLMPGPTEGDLFACHFRLRGSAPRSAGRLDGHASQRRLAGLPTPTPKPPGVWWTRGSTQ